MARSPCLVCILAGRRVRPGSRRPRVERGVWSEVREGVGGVGLGPSGTASDFPSPSPLPSLFLSPSHVCVYVCVSVCL